MQNTNGEGWAVIIDQPKESGTERTIVRTIIAIFSAEHNAKFYVKKTYAKSLYLNPEILKVHYQCEKSW